MEKRKLLFVDCCIRDEESRTALAAERFLKCIADDYEVVRLDLAEAAAGKLTDEIYRDFPVLGPHTREDIDKMEKAGETGDFSEPLFAYARQFAAADRILIAAPFWDFSFPALLKVYYEAISVCGITFCYEGADSKGLCRAEKAVYISTCGGYAGEFHHGEEYTKAVMKMFGIEDFAAVRVEGLDVLGADVDAIMDGAAEEIKKKARAF